MVTRVGSLQDGADYTFGSVIMKDVGPVSTVSRTKRSCYQLGELVVLASGRAVEPRRQGGLALLSNRDFVVMARVSTFGG
jgi:hypothetical protein